ncbi:MAG TPA: hypothetical protein VGI19_03290 [Candidatus Cybelea sp.]|jgi:hypothetical protein
MKISNFSRYALGIILTAAAFAGCSGSQAIAPSATQLSNVIPTQGRGGSWMRSGTSEDLLYVSDSGSNSVYVYSFPDGTLAGTLTGLNNPQGDCVDASQNVWIANAGANDTIEYAHGGTSPLATLHDPGKYPPFACAIDPTTGNLAITNAEPPYGRGEVMIYRNAQGTPRAYKVSSVPHLYYDGYDNQGNLFVDGITGNFGHRHHEPNAAFAELAKHSKSFVGIPLYGGAFFARPGGVQWDGKYITVVNVNVVYEIKISGGHGNVVGSTTPSGTYDSEVLATAISGSYLAASTSNPSSGGWGVGIWKYPSGKSGGTLQGTFTAVHGVAVSLASTKNP